MRKKTSCFAFLLSLLTFTSTAQYVQVNNTCGFAIGGTAYRPLVCNYSIEFLPDNTGAWYISPEQDCSGNWSAASNRYIFEPGGSVSDPVNVSLSKNKLIADLVRIRSLGFTEIRLIGASLPISIPGVATYPTGSQTTYFALMDHFLSQVDSVGLRIIYTLGGLSGNYDFANNLAFKNFITTVATHYSTNTAIMAYDIFNEPENTLWPASVNDKYNFTKLYSEWCNSVKTADQNHLITIGFGTPESIFYNDPSLLPIDFISFHAYSLQNTGLANLSNAEDLMDVFYYWWGKTMTIPWIIGETSYSASDAPYSGPSQGTEAEQSLFAQHTLKRSVDCNCKGYSWWKYQNTHWGDPYQDYMGIYNLYSGTSDGSAKPVASAFPTYAGMTQAVANCTIAASTYTSILNGTTSKLTGIVKDNLGAAKANAVILGRDVAGTLYTTFTDASGAFNLKTNGGAIQAIYISYPGYSAYSQWGGTFSNGTLYTLTKVNYNSWVKEWSNSDASNTLSNNWNLTAYDKFYNGDFNGDGVQDVLCVKYTNSTITTDRMVILTYTNSFNVIAYDSHGNPFYDISSGWSLIWDNQSSSAYGGGIYPYRNNLTVGDFDGDHRDDVISINGSGGWTTWFTFVPNSNPTLATWYWEDSNYGTVNNSSHPMSFIAPYSSGVAGDFYNLGKAAIIAVSPVWLTSFQLVGGVWTWVQSNNGQTNNPALGNEMSYLTPYTAQLVPGDFDGDGQAEILGNALPSGAMALFKPRWDATASTWHWDNKWIDNTNSSGMYAYRNNLLVGNFDSDASSEILGFSSSSVVAFDYNCSSSCSLVWDGSNYATISDWNISPAAKQYLFVKTDANSKQQQLLAVKGSIANLYAFRPNIESLSPCSTLRLASSASQPDNIKENQINTNEVSIYPNPGSGEYTLIMAVTATLKDIFVYDVNGRIVYQSKGVSERAVKINLNNEAQGVYIVRVTDGASSITKKLVKE